MMHLGQKCLGFKNNFYLIFQRPKDVLGAERERENERGWKSTDGRR